MLTLAYIIALFALPFFAAPDRADARPHWSKRRPREAGYWMGIGIARHAEGEDALPRARTEALRDIAAQIETHLTAKTHLVQREGADGLAQEYRVEIRAEARGQLEQVEIVDTWDDDEHVWVYARMSIAEYDRRRRERAENALALSAEYAQRADECADHDPAAALALLIRALETARPAQKLDPTLAARAGEVGQRIQQLLMSIELGIAAPSGPLKSGVPLNTPLQITARTRVERRPVAGLPLSCRFARGRGALDTLIWTGADGAATAVLRRIDDDAATQTVVVRVDPSAFAADLHPHFNAPFAVLDLQVARRRIHLACEGRPALADPFADALAALLSQQGLELAADAQEADLALALNIRVDEQRSFQGLHFAYLDLDLDLRDRHSGAGLQRAVRRIKGAGASPPQAEAQARQRAGQRIDEILTDALAALYGSSYEPPTKERNPK